jgi:hypothetical protein
MTPGGGEVSVRVRFAGLEGYLLSKCVAVRTRGLEKDYYDFAFVLLHNRAGGAEAAAAQLRQGNLSDALPALRSTFLEVRERYVRSNDVGPASYADQSLQVSPFCAPQERASRRSGVEPGEGDVMAAGACRNRPLKTAAPPAAVG